jgi:hypothetical protein
MKSTFHIGLHFIVCYLLHNACRGQGAVEIGVTKAGWTLRIRLICILHHKLTLLLLDDF